MYLWIGALNQLAQIQLGLDSSRDIWWDDVCCSQRNQPVKWHLLSNRNWQVCWMKANSWYCCQQSYRWCLMFVTPFIFRKSSLINCTYHHICSRARYDLLSLFFLDIDCFAIDIHCQWKLTAFCGVCWNYFIIASQFIYRVSLCWQSHGFACTLCCVFIHLGILDSECIV